MCAFFGIPRSCYVQGVPWMLALVVWFEFCTALASGRLVWRWTLDKLSTYFRFVDALGTELCPLAKTGTSLGRRSGMMFEL